MALVFVLSMAIPYIGFILNVLMVPLTFRRLHDTGRSGWWLGLGVLLQGGCIIFLLREIASLILESQTADEYFVDVLWHWIAQCGLWLAIIVIYQVVMIVFLCMDSEKYENKYGSSPKYVDEEPSEDAEEGSFESY